MYTQTSILALAALLASTITGAPTQSSVPPTTPGLTLFQQLVLAPSAVERSKLLKDDDYVFQFNDPARTTGVAKGLGGNVTRADADTFPALVGQGGAMAIGFLGPCGFNTPHVHPRAAELNLVIQGSLQSETIFENGARFIRHHLPKFAMTVFPMGAVHTEFNPECTDSIFVAGFTSEEYVPFPHFIKTYCIGRISANLFQSWSCADCTRIFWAVG